MFPNVALFLIVRWTSKQKPKIRKFSPMGRKAYSQAILLCLMECRIREILRIDHTEPQTNLAAVQVKNKCWEVSNSSYKEHKGE
jgi:hypothetical protein